MQVVMGPMILQAMRINRWNSVMDFKFPGKYNKLAGNQTARDLFWFYFSSIFLGK